MARPSARGAAASRASFRACTAARGARHASRAPGALRGCPAGERRYAYAVECIDTGPTPPQRRAAAACEARAARTRWHARIAGTAPAAGPAAASGERRCQPLPPRAARLSHGDSLQPPPARRRRRRRRPHLEEPRLLRGDVGGDAEVAEAAATRLRGEGAAERPGLAQRALFLLRSAALLALAAAAAAAAAPSRRARSGGVRHSVAKIRAQLSCVARQLSHRRDEQQEGVRELLPHHLAVQVLVVQHARHVRPDVHQAQAQQPLQRRGVLAAHQEDHEVDKLRDLVRPFCRRHQHRGPPHAHGRPVAGTVAAPGVPRLQALQLVVQVRVRPAPRVRKQHRAQPQQQTLQPRRRRCPTSSACLPLAAPMRWLRLLLTFLAPRPARVAQ
eukprot:scaffold8147_cov296-Prasinococcus_capsulatus_cf.AAC.1